MRKEMNYVSESCNVCIKGYYPIRNNQQKLSSIIRNRNGIKKECLIQKVLYYTENVTFEIFLFKTFPDIENQRKILLVYRR